MSTDGPFQKLEESGLPSGLLASFAARLESARALGEPSDWYKLAAWISGALSGVSYCQATTQAQLEALEKAHDETLRQARKSRLNRV